MIRQKYKWLLECYQNYMMNFIKKINYFKKLNYKYKN